MKRTAYILLLTVLAAFTGCATSELAPTQEAKISFEVGNYAVAITRANTAVEFNYFTSKAFLHAEGYTSETQTIFGDGETIVPNNASAPTSWGPSRDYYWPKGASSYINFVSWYDALGAPTTATEEQLVWSNRTIGATDNILVADAAWRYSQNTSNAAQYTGDAITSGVPTLFHHMLSKIAFNVSAAPLTDPVNSSVTYEVKIQSMSLSSLHNQGSLTLTNGDPGTDATTVAWTPSNTTYFWSTQGTAAGSIAMSAMTNCTLSETPTAALANCSVIPQPLNETTLDIVFTVTTKSNGTVTIMENDIPASIRLNTIKNTSNVAISEWLPNRIYTYNLLIDPRGTEIRLAPVLESDWSEIGTSATVE